MFGAFQVLSYFTLLWVDNSRHRQHSWELQFLPFSFCFYFLSSMSSPCLVTNRWNTIPLMSLIHFFSPIHICISSVLVILKLCSSQRLKKDMPQMDITLYQITFWKKKKVQNSGSQRDKLFVLRNKIRQRSIVSVG